MGCNFFFGSHRRVVAIQKLESLQQILAFMGCGPISMMATTQPAVTQTITSIHPRYSICTLVLIIRCVSVFHIEDRGRYIVLIHDDILYIYMYSYKLQFYYIFFIECNWIYTTYRMQRGPFWKQSALPSVFVRTQFIECPVFPKGNCGSEIEFPTFWNLGNILIYHKWTL